MKKWFYLLSQYNVYDKLIFIYSALVFRLSKNISISFNESRIVFDRLYDNGFSMRRLDGYTLVSGNNINFELRKNTSDVPVCNQIIIQEEYKPIVEIFINQSAEIRWMVDAGANIGLTSIYFKDKFKQVNIVALEPNQENYEQLCRNVRLNNYTLLTCLKVGLWNQPCFLEPSTDFGDKRHWAFSLKESSTQNSKSLIECIDITTLIKISNVPIIDFLKIDIEGAEEIIFLNNITHLQFLNKVNVIAREIQKISDIQKYESI